MVAYLDKVKSILMKIKDFKIRQIPIEENRKVDALANLASTFDFIIERNVPLEFLPSSSIEVAKPVCKAESIPTWMDDINSHLQDGMLPTDKLQAHHIQYHLPNFASSMESYTRDLF